jgi:quinol monooxygenase YgiN
VIYVVATIRIKPGTFSQVAAAARPAIEATRKEKGCISYDMHQSATDPETVVFVERWEERDNLASHMQQPHFLAWRKAGAEFILDRKIEIITPAKVDTP